jgi:hypothetical protein
MARKSEETFIVFISCPVSLIDLFYSNIDPTELATTVKQRSPFFCLPNIRLLIYPT